MKITVRFSVDSEIALNCDRFPGVDWNAVIENAIRVKAKILRQGSGTAVPAVDRDPMPWLKSAERKREERPVRPKKPPRPKPAPVTAEEILRRAAELRAAR